MLEWILLLWYEDKAQGRWEREQGQGEHKLLLSVACAGKKKKTNPQMLPWLFFFGVINPGCTAFKMLADGGPEQN